MLSVPSRRRALLAKIFRSVARLKLIRASVFFLILLFLYSVCVLQIAFRLPAFASPNEALHYEHFVLIRKTGRLPDLHSSTRADERHQPPLYYALAALFSLPFPDPPLDTELPTNPHFLSTHVGNLNPVVPVTPAQLPALYVARLTSAVIGLLALVGVYLGARRLVPDDYALLIVSLLAFQPMFLFLSGTINNDLAAAAFAGLAVTWMAVLTLQDAPPRHFGAIGVLLGLAMLSKANTVFLLLLIPLSAFFLWMSTRQWQRPIAAAAWAIVGFAPLWGLWLVANALRGEDVFGVSRSVPIQAILAAPLTDLLLLLPHLEVIYRTFWFDWSLGGVGFAPNWLYVLSAVSIVVGLSGWMFYRRNMELSRWTLALPVMHAGWAAALVLIYLLTRTLAVRPLGGVIPEGRLLLPIVPSLAWLTACGCLCWWSARWRRPVALLSALAPALLGVYFSFFWLPQHYPQAQRLTSSDVAALALFNESLRYDDTIALHGVEIEPLYTGQVAEVTLYWEALRQVEQNYTVSLQVLIPTSPFWTVSDQQHSYPGAGLSPTQRWQAGDWYADRYQIVPGTDLNGPTRALLGVWLLEDVGENKAPLRVLRGSQIYDPPIVSEAVIRPQEPLQPLAEHLLAEPAQFGDVAALIGVEWLFAASVPDEITGVVLWWKALDANPVDYTVFVHAADANGALLAQNDGPPNLGLSPTRLWAPGDVIRDERRFAEPIPVGCELLVGLYAPQTLERLPAYVDGTRLLDDAVRLTCGANESLRPAAVP
ncbi:glycosyltransferase family 39 protein [Caldilinea sp.]|jgi:4-amino-4-deoxy-L-arabinose transferase-like glycosyltransferase|uniref:glycosyltransferase family 39 protein n=1 Tax=Caldilinea sp. TaxID=2293560 RepID=UPI0021DB9A4D|nr:glycosyltransferase family 39 protein [Caldilinea sp.]GIV75550.1 MAG: hypothetical protein KatS3mg049_4106 [Caldilinea sp.]